MKINNKICDDQKKGTIANLLRYYFNKSLK